MEELFKWFDSHPFKSIVTYTILVAGAVFAFAKFVLIENNEKAHSTQLETKDAVIQQKEAIISQCEARIRFLETENNRLEEEKNRYFGWLLELPDSFQYIERQNERLMAQVEELKHRRDSKDFYENTKYSSLYDSTKKNTSIADPHTGIIASMTSIYADNTGELYIKGPECDVEKILCAKSGLVREYSINEKKYQFVLMSIDYVSSKYSVLIREI